MTEDPYESVEYQKFVEEQAQYCFCEPSDMRPCDGVLAGGPCDRNIDDHEEFSDEWEEDDSDDIPY